MFMEVTAKTLVEVSRSRAEKESEKPAFILLGDGEVESERMTFALLDQKARAIAAQLQEWNLVGQRAMLIYPHGLDFLTAFMGCLYAGVVAVPTYPPNMRKRLSWGKLEAIISDAGAAVVLSTAGMMGQMDELLSSSATSKALKRLATDQLSLGLAAEWKEFVPRPEELAFLQYSSGSTGRPKGVMLSHGNLINNQLVFQAFSQERSEGTYVSWLPLYHDMGLGLALQTVALGCLNVLMSPSAFVQKPRRWLWAISRYQAHISGGPNFSYDLCVRDMKPEYYEGLDLSSWTTALNGAEVINARVLQEFTRLFEPYGFNPRTMRPGYGLAEATVAVTVGDKFTLPVIKHLDAKQLQVNRVQEVDEARTGTLSLLGCGYPRLGHEMAIVNPETRRTSLPGEVGEVWLRGDSVGMGYWNNPQATEEIFQARTSDTAQGPYLRTGDLGFIHDNSLFLTGRMKELIIIRGRNHYPEDIERTVLSCHPGLRGQGGAAFSVMIDGEERLVVVQEPERAAIPSIDPRVLFSDVRAAIAANHELQLHAMVLIEPGSLPKTSSGKIQRRASQQMFVSGSHAELARWVAPAEEVKASAPPAPAERPAAPVSTVAPAAMVRRLAAHVAARVGIAPEQYDVDKPFNHYALDSRALVELSGTLAEALGRPLSPTALYEYPSVAALARYLSDIPETDSLASGESIQQEPIAIIGLGCRFPGGAQSPRTYWELLRGGVDAVSEVPADRWNVDALYSPTVTPGKTSTRWGGFLSAVDQFDADFFDISPREAASMDPQQRLLLEVSWDALEHAGKAPDALAGSQTGVFVGISGQDYARLQFGLPSGTNAFAGTGNALSIAANRLSYALDLRGPSMAVDTACSSSLVALHAACQSLKQGECDLALAGGVNLILSPDHTITFSQAGMMAADGRCKTFDASADGYVRGEGCGVVVLKRLSEAQRDGDRILAVVRGSAVNQDGRSNGLTAPNGLAQEAVIRRALAVAGVEASEVDYVEAHGTGTALGDPIEVRALAQVFNPGREDGQRPLWVGSAKTNLGHLESAAGIAGVIKVALALHHRQLPASLHFKTPSPHIPWDKIAIKVPTAHQDWTPGPRAQRLAGVSSFGFGGTNAHVILEEAPADVTRPSVTERPQHLLALSAKNPAGLRQLIERYVATLASSEPGTLADLCFSTHTGRAQLGSRVAVVGQDAQELRRKLEQAILDLGTPGARPDTAGRPPREVAFLFTGQGALYAGVAQELYATQPLFRELIDQCDALLRPSMDRSLVSLLWGENSALLHETRYTQPVLFALEYALARLWLSWGIVPSAVMGHSIGEYAAACIAGVFTLGEGLRLTAARGRLMDELTQRGDMAVLFAPLDEVRAAVAPYPEQVSIAAENGPANVVISGESAVVRRLVEEATARGVRAQTLKVSHAFHSPLMRPMLDAFLEVARGIPFREPVLPLVSGVTGKRVGKEVLEPSYWVEHVRGVVRFAEATRTLREQEPGFFLEIGPGATLVSMACAQDEAQGIKGLTSLDRERGDWARLLTSLGQLFEGGVRVDWKGVEQGSARRRVDVPAYPFQRRRHWLEETQAAGAVVDANVSVDGFLVEQTWERVAESVDSAQALEAGVWLVLGGQSLGEALAGQLEARGGRSIRVEAGESFQRGEHGPWSVNPSRSEDFARLLQEVGAPVRGIVHLWSLESAASEELTLARLEQAQRLSSLGLVSLLQALAKRVASESHPRLWVVTRAAVPAGAEPVPPAMAQAAIWGLGKVVALEHPEWWGGLVDLPAVAEADEASGLLRELTRASSEQQVALRSEGRYVARLVPASARASKPLPVRADGTYLVTGGLGALGLRTARWLVSRGARHLVLVGRSAGEGAARNDLDMLQRSGATVRVLRADVAREEDVAGVLRQIQESMPPLRGLFHAAGVSGGRRPLEDMRAEDLESVFGAKVSGSWALHQATRTLELDFFVGFSSIASVWGSSGQAHYAAGNHFLDMLAHHRRLRGLPALTINWGPWAETGMGSATELKTWLAPLGIQALSPASGLAALERLLSTDGVQTTVAHVDWSVFKDVYEARGRRPLLERLVRESSTPSTSATLDLSRKTPATLELLTGHIQRAVGKVLGFEPSQLPERDRGLTTLGMNSLMAVELKSALQALVGRPLPATVAFDYPTIDALATHLLGLVTPEAAPAAGAQALAPTRTETVAIIGIGCRFPGGADSPQAFWELLQRGEDAISDNPSERWDVERYLHRDPDAPGKTYSLSAGLLRQVDMFDATFFGISPREAEAMDPQQRLALELSWAAVESAGYSPASLAGSQTGVFMGVGANEYGRICEAAGDAIDTAYTSTGNALNAIAGRVAYTLGLQGPSMAIDTACSSSMVAVHLACQSLLRGECDTALAGGVNLLLAAESFVSLSKGRMLAPNGRCRTFDADAEGYVRAEGGGILVLKRLSEAVAAGDPIVAVIRGSAINQDGRSSGLTVPRGPAQQAVITSALASAGITPAEVQLVEAHGTGTSLGDPIEMHALDAVYGAGRTAEHPLVVGSVKTNIGHAEAASGVASLIKLALALHHGEIPPHLHFKQLNPHILVEPGRIRIPTERMAWPAGARKRIAAASAFGFSGTNAHVVLEEAPIPAARTPERRATGHVLTLSGRSEEAVKAAARDYARLLSSDSAPALEDICHTTQLGRAHFKHRMAVIGEDRTTMLARLQGVSQGEALAGTVLGEATATPEKLAFLFTGQGSQYAGMARELFETEPVFARTLSRCDALLRPILGHSLPSLMWGEASEHLNNTRFTQPVLFALEYALAALWGSWGVSPAVVMGHSVGEFVAACVAGVFSLEDGLRLIEARGRLMADLPEGGEMVAVMADEEQVKEALAAHVGELSIAGYNGPAQLVLSGASRAMHLVREELGRAGIETRKLPISFASHSPLMAPILARFAEVTATVRYTPPRLPVVSNVTGELAGPDIATADYWVRHVSAAVRFQQGIETAWAHGCRIFLELGPQHTLVALGQKCVPEQEGVWLASLRKSVKDGTQLMTALGHLFVQGIDVQWSALHEGTASRRVALPTYPFQRKRYWAEARGSRRSTLVPVRSQQSLGAPYPGRRLRLPMSKDLRFEIELSAHSPTFLDDHRIHGTVVVPGASHVSMLLSALSTVRDPRLGVNSVQDVTFLQALVLPDPQRRTVQLSLEKSSKEGFNFQIGSFLGEGDEPAWVVHATGRAQTQPRGKSVTEVPDTVALRAAARDGFTGDSFYSDFWEMGYTLGSSFRWIGEAWLLEGEVLCALTQPVSGAEADLYQLHPGLIDSCFQLVGCVAGSPTALKSKDELFVPFHIDGFHFHGRPKPGARLWCHVKRRGEYIPASNSLTGDILIFDDEGNTLASVEGFQVRRTHRDVFLQVHQDAYRDWLYSVEWKPQAPVGGLRVDYLPGAAALRSGLMPYAQELTRTLELDAYTAVLDKLEDLSLSYVHRALEQLGVVLQKGQTFSTESLMERAGVVRRHQRMFHRVLEMLAENGELRLDADRWSVVSGPSASESSWSSLLAQHPAQKAELNFLEQCGRRLATVLRGEVDPVQVLFPGGDLSAASALYSNSVGTKALNLLVERTLSLALEQLPEGRPLRILEVGAGTGGTTARILPFLSAKRPEYVYTDVSPLFTEKARETFQAYPFIRYEVLDIEKSPVEQGFEAHRYDIVVAANVLHTTKDMHQTLRHVHELMAPGGLLVMVEGTARQRWLDLIFGLTDGWWRFEDVALRPAYPLLSGESWKRVLSETGFEGTEVLIPGRDMPQGVIFARAGDASLAAPARAEQWLVLADEGDTGRRLGELLAGGGANCVLARVGERYEQHADGSFTIRPTQADDFQRMLAALRSTSDTLRGVVHLWSLNSPPMEDTLPLGDLADAATMGCQSALHLVQSLLKEHAARPPSLWLVTQGAQSLEPASSVPGLAHASLWGMGRVIALEHPELNCVRVDLHPSQPDAEALYRELFSSRREDQVLLHGTARHVARLAPLREEAPAKVVFHPEATYLLTGGTGGLGLLTAQWMVQKGARHLVLLGRSDAEERTRSERAELERLGAEVVLVQADVGDPRQMELVLARMDRTMPPLRGVIHGVGVLDDGILLHQTWDRFARVLSPKVDGAWNLHTLTADRELDFFVLYSSAVSLMGSPGQANHAAANAFLDGLASYRRAQGKPALSINWGPWSGKGAASGKELGDRWALKGIGTISPVQGIEILEQLFSSSTQQVGVLPVHWPAFLSQFPEDMAPPFLQDVTPAPAPVEEEIRHEPRQQVSASDLRRQLAQAPKDKQQELLVSYIRSSMAQSLKLAATELDVDQPLNTLGVDSLLAVEFKKRIRTDLDIDIPVVSMLEGLSIKALAARISGSQPSSDPAPVPVAADAAQDMIEGAI